MDGVVGSGPGGVGKKGSGPETVSCCLALFQAFPRGRPLLSSSDCEYVCVYIWGGGGSWGRQGRGDTWSRKGDGV